MKQDTAELNNLQAWPKPENFRSFNERMFRNNMSDMNYDNGQGAAVAVQYESEVSLSETNIDIRVYPIEEPQNSTIAFAKVAVDGIVVISGVRIVEGDESSFVAMPQSQGKDGRYHDTAFLVEEGLYEQISTAVLSEYDSPSLKDTDNKSFIAAERDPADVSLETKVFPNKNPRSSIKAFASVTLDGKVAIRGITVDVDNRGRLYVNMPYTTDKNGTPRDVAYPILPGLRKEISKAVLADYRETVKTASLAANLKEGKAQAAQHVPAQKTPDMARSAAAARS